MDIFDAADIVRQACLQDEAENARGEIRLATCPHCGKGDRIVCWQMPQAMNSHADSELQEAWRILCSDRRQVGLCGFCQNLVLMERNRAIRPS